MNRTNWSVLAIAVGVALATGWWVGRSTAPDTAPSADVPAALAERQVLYYRNPMGLPDTSPVPKKDAMGMDYIPVFAGGEPAAEPGTVVLPPEKVQKLGVRTELAVRESLAGAVRASATVQVDETRQFVIAPKFEGWIETLYANQTGMTVQKGQPLMALYSPELVAAQSEYEIADAAARRMASADPASAATMRQLRDAARARLRNWDVGGAQVARQGSNSRLVLTAPADAVVVEKLVVQGDRFEPGQTILRLADLSTVWVVADVPTSAAAGLTVGGEASFQTPSLPGERFTGRVSFIQPLVNAASRTIGVRIELPNPEGALRPGLFGDVDLTGTATDAAVVIPRSAVIDSGTRQLVLVQTAPGRFAPRTVRVGARSGDRIEVLSGVAVGEAVVVSANFLIDAESNLRSAMQGMDHGAAPPPTAEGNATPVKPEEAPAAPDPHASHTGGQ
jgi:Cu(I)/Ag(I) efflux system membrane fusion protein